MDEVEITFKIKTSTEKAEKIINLLGSLEPMLQDLEAIVEKVQGVQEGSRNWRDHHGEGGAL